jgi:hypothetical protein
MTFNPYTGSTNLPKATSSQNQLVLTQAGGLFLRDFNGNVTTGFDPGTAAAVTPDGKKLVTLLQSATIQDSTNNQQDRTNTR